MEKQELFGQLFKTIPLYSEEHLDFLLKSMGKEEATYYLIQAIKYAYDSGVFTMGESEILSKSIRIISQNSIENKELIDK